MTQMTAQLASKLADDVYAISKMSSIQVALNELNRKYPNLFTFADSILPKAPPLTLVV